MGLQLSGSIQLEGNLLVTGSANSVFENVLVSGKLTAQEIETQLVSSSIIYSSGSNKFGDLVTDTQQFTGSVDVSGSLSVNGNLQATTLVRTGGISTQFLKADGSVDSTSYAITSSLDNYLLLSGGTLTGALNGTSAVFSGGVNLATVSGNVGIGVTGTPIDKMQIVGGLTLTTSLAAPTNTSIGSLQIGYSGTEGVIRTFNSSPIKIDTSGVERLRITSGGFTKASNDGTYVGVTGNYHELRTNQTDQWATIITNTSAAPYALTISYPNTSPNNADNWFIFCQDSSTARFRVASNGNVTNQNGSYGSISDAKLKENIIDASEKLDDLMKVKIRNYNFIGDDKKQIGVIAQELEEVFPAMIDESEDFEEVEVPQLDDEGNKVLNEEEEVVTEKQRVSKGTSTKSVKYSVFVPMLIKAIQELKTEIDSLKNQIK